MTCERKKLVDVLNVYNRVSSYMGFLSIGSYGALMVHGALANFDLVARIPSQYFFTGVAICGAMFAFSMFLALKAFHLDLQMKEARSNCHLCSPKL